VDQDRSFFGVVRVTAEDGGRVLTMRHGTTVHGIQNLDPVLRATPLTYYHPSGPMGSAVAGAGPEERIGVVGLGTGALAALADPGQEIVFHEIDPLVAEMARSHFSFLEDSPGEPSIVLGDGRLTLADTPDGYYDLLILDAYSSDYVPIHLLTTEAVELYLDKVAAGGVVLFHISNRFADLSRVIKGVAGALGRPATLAWHTPSDSLAALGVAPSLVAAVAKGEDALRSLDRELGWAPPDADLEGVVWTDSKASLLSVLR
jgi:spermidine synthase